MFIDFQIVFWDLIQLKPLNELRLNFSLEKDYKWWELLEITGPDMNYQALGGRMRLICTSSHDSLTYVICVNVDDFSCDIVFRIKQQFHPRGVAQLFNSEYIVLVGMTDDLKVYSGRIEIINFITGKSMGMIEEKFRLCALTSIKLENDIVHGSDVEYLYLGTSKQRSLLTPLFS